MAILKSVNVGVPRPKEWAEIGRSGIDKTATSEPVEATPMGLVGDRVADTRHHGGIDQAVYAFAREDLDWWQGELGRPIRDGQFGENLTTEGVDLNDLEVGTLLAIGTAVFEIASVRVPCNDFKGWMGESGFDNTAWVKRFTAVGRPGPYLRVTTPGVVTAGDEIRIGESPGHGVTVTTMFRALTTDRGLLPELLKVPGMVAKARARAEEWVATQVTTS